MDFKYLYMHALSHPLVRRINLRFILLLPYLRKAYRHYILASRDFTHLRPLAFLWISFNENNNMKIGNSHNIIYIGNPNYIYTT